ncbi:MAG: CAP domain-containing protein [Anaerolineales bacterium]|nr:CAP domain-containing protein [Anaerolineales bacterium]
MALIILLNPAHTTESTPRQSSGTLAPNAYLPLVIKLPTPTPTSTPVSTLIPPDDPAIEQSIADQINGERTLNGLPAYTSDADLVQAARSHCRDMADNNITGHPGSDGSSACQRMEEAGYDWDWCGEIIGWGFGGDPDLMFNWWMNSPLHHSMILATAYEDIGSGYAYNADSDYKHYWTVDMGSRTGRSDETTANRYTCSFSSIGPDGGISLVIISLTPCDLQN